MNDGPAGAGEATSGAYRRVREVTTSLCETLATEDFVVQSMPDASPAKWHLAHTTWFFETFVLRNLPGHGPFHAAYEVLFNSYYNAVGEQFPRAERGLLSRPTVSEVMRYRKHVDEAMTRALDGGRLDPPLRAVVTLGLNHEQQHQELLLTDVKHLLSLNPLRPAFRERPADAAGAAPPLRFVRFAGGIREIGFAGTGFSFDNETPRHRRLLADFEIASRPVTNSEFLDFIDDGGYRRPELWLSEGWAAVREERWTSPMHWDIAAGRTFTLAGPRELDRAEPVCHVSYFEADAYARWAGARLPLEDEWEVAAAAAHVAGNLLERGRLHPAAAPSGDGEIVQLFGDVWEWTASPYVGYPGYRADEGALGEYNGKFMCNQFVLRGGSCVTPQDHVRASYRNFFPPRTRWQFSGIRLAR